MFVYLLIALAVADDFPAPVYQSADLPVYCRLLEVALEEVENAPVIENFKVSSDMHVTLLGDVDFTLSHLELGTISVKNCGAEANKDGTFNIGMTDLSIQVKEFHYSYLQKSWPHTGDNGTATGMMDASFNFSIDMLNQVDRMFEFKIGALKIDMESTYHSWLYGALTKLAEIARPLVSATFQHEAKEAIDRQLAYIHKNGACHYLESDLSMLKYAKLEYRSLAPELVHVPVVGDINVSVNSTFVSPPTSMKCQHVAFNGSLITAHLEDIHFNTSFHWNYTREHAWFFDGNHGNGSAEVTGGAMVHIDLLNPKQTKVVVDFPELALKLDATTHHWLYSALTSTMVPLVRHMLQSIGSKYMTYEIEKCLADPKCPHVMPPPPPKISMMMQPAMIV